MLHDQQVSKYPHIILYKKLVVTQESCQYLRFLYLMVVRQEDLYYGDDNSVIVQRNKIHTYISSHSNV